MGNICHGGATKVNGEEVDEHPSNKAKKMAANPIECHALVVYVDYGFQPAKSQGWCPAGFGDRLDTKENADFILELLEGAEVASITKLANTDATKEAVVNAIHEVGLKCDDNDVFFFFYSGHGAQMPDTTGDEEDGMDEAMCVPSSTGECNMQTWLSDDEFSMAVHEVTAGNKLIIMDCCHSGTMMDFSHEIWSEHEITDAQKEATLEVEECQQIDLNRAGWGGQKCISITGCKDEQESAGMGGGTRGGAFSKCLYHATKAIGNEQVTVGAIYNHLLQYKDTFIPAGHRQEIQLQCAPGCQANDMIYPLQQKK